MALPPVDQLPLLLAGPILRRVDKTHVYVWVALKAAARVQLQLMRPPDPIIPGDIVDTIQIGIHLHVALAPIPLGEPLVAGQLYSYDVTCSVDGGPFQSMLTDGIITSPAYPIDAI